MTTPLASRRRRRRVLAARLVRRLPTEAGAPARPQSAAHAVWVDLSS